MQTVLRINPYDDSSHFYYSGGVWHASESILAQSSTGDFFDFSASQVPIEELHLTTEDIDSGATATQKYRIRGLYKGRSMQYIMEKVINTGITYKVPYETEYSDGSSLADFICDDHRSLLLCGDQGIHINTVEYPSDEETKLVRLSCPGQPTAIGYDFFEGSRPFELDWDVLGRNATNPPLSKVEFPSASWNSEVIWQGENGEVYALGDNHGPELLNPPTEVRNSQKRFAYTLSVYSEKVLERDWCKPYPDTYEGYLDGIEQEGWFSAFSCYHSYKMIQIYLFWVGEMMEIEEPYNLSLLVGFPWLQIATMIYLYIRQHWIVRWVIENWDDVLFQIGFGFFVVLTLPVWYIMILLTEAEEKY